MVDFDGINVGKIYQSTMDPILDLLKQCLETVPKTCFPPMVLKHGEFTMVQIRKKIIQAVGVRGQIPGGEKTILPSKSTQQKHQQGDLAMCYHHFFPEKNGGGGILGWNETSKKLEVK